MRSKVVQHLSKYRLEWLIAALSLFTFLLYALNMSGNFIEGFDDDWWIYDNPLAQNLSMRNLWKIWSNQTLDCYYLPLTFTFFTIEVAIWGNNAYLFKLFNLTIFICNAWMISSVLRKAGIAKGTVLLTVALFLLHPLQAENVLWPVCLRQLLSTFFILGAIYFLQKGRCLDSLYKQRWYWLVVFSYFLAVMTKPTAVVFIVIPFTLFFYRAFLAKKERMPIADFILGSIPFACILLFSTYMNAVAAQRNFLETEFNYTVLQHWLIIFSSYGHYFVKLFTGPYQIFYLLPPAHDFDYLGMGALSFVAMALFVLGVYFLYKKQWALSISIAWFFVALMPSALLVVLMSDFPANSADRYFLMASPGIFLLLATGIHHFFKQYAIPFSLLLIIPMAYATYQQTKVWEDAGTMMAHSLSINPTEEMHYRSAMFYQKKGDNKLALKHLKAARSLQKGALFNSPFVTNLQIAYLYQGMGDTAEAKNIIVSAFLKDLTTAESSLTYEILQQKAAEMLPLEDGNQKDTYRYIQIRKRLLEEHPGSQLRPKRL